MRPLRRRHGGQTGAATAGHDAGFFAQLREDADGEFWPHAGRAGECCLVLRRDGGDQLVGRECREMPSATFAPTPCTVVSNRNHSRSAAVAKP